VEKAGLGVPQKVVLADDRAWLRFDDGTLCWGATPSESYPRSIVDRVSECSEALKVSAFGWEPTEALQAVQRVTIYATPEQPVSVSGTGEEVVFKTTGPRGEAKETVSATVREPAAIYIQATMLLDAVGRFEDCAVNTADTYAMFRTKGKELLVMGMVV
jgi:hypothetical protein